MARDITSLWHGTVAACIVSTYCGLFYFWASGVPVWPSALCVILLTVLIGGAWHMRAMLKGAVQGSDSSPAFALARLADFPMRSGIA
jgi:hypothetical protein